MLAGERGWGGGGERPFLPRAFSVADAVAGDDGVRLSFLLEEVGPGTEALARLAPGDGLLLTGPLGRPFSAPDRAQPRRCRRDPRRRRHRAGAAGALAPAARGPRDPGAVAARLPRSGIMPAGWSCSAARRSGSPARTVTPGIAATSPTSSPGCWRGIRRGPPSSTRAGRRRCWRPCGRCARTAGSRPSWRWSRRWRAVTAPASAVRCRCDPAATCGSASTAR